MKRLTILISTLLFLPFQIANAQSGIAYYVEAENPAAFIQALAVLNELPVTNIQTSVSIAVANGSGAATHLVSVQGDSLADDAT